MLVQLKRACWSPKPSSKRALGQRQKGLLLLLLLLILMLLLLLLLILLLLLLLLLILLLLLLLVLKIGDTTAVAALNISSWTECSIFDKRR